MGCLLLITSAGWPNRPLWGNPSHLQSAADALKLWSQCRKFRPRRQCARGWMKHLNILLVAGSLGPAPQAL